MHSTLYSIGHGNKTFEQFVSELKKFEIQYVVDVRSKPYSKHNPHFNMELLKKMLEKEGITYVFMGNLLGGRPDDSSCYTNGYVDYNKLRTKPFFIEGINRLITANKKGIKLAIMCSETNPAKCHRSKLIGEELRKKGIILNHIVIHPITKEIITKSQNQVIQEVLPMGTKTLFGKEIQLTSRKKYIDE